MRADTVAKLLHEWQRGDRPPLPEFRLGAWGTLVVDEASMVSTPALHQLVTLAEANRWRVVLVGDDRQLQAVGRGGLFAELCTNGRVDELVQLHRFKHRWEAAASLQLRSGDPRALDAYETHDRIIPGSLADHLAAMAATWIEDRRNGDTVALVASTNDHVDAVNRAVQAARVAAGQLNPDIAAQIAGGECAHVGDVVATRRNDRTLITSSGERVRNRETWTITAIGSDGSLTVTREHGHGTVTLPNDYSHEHVRLGYAATEHGYQSDTVDHSLSLVSAVTTRRGLYVAATRGREQNLLCVVTDSTDVAEARDTLETILAFDRADIPAVTQRRNLARQQPLEAAQQRPKPTSRREIPQWFEPLRAELRDDLYDAEQALAASEAKRARLAAEATAAEHDLVGIESATAPARQALAAATSDYEEAGGATPAPSTTSTTAASAADGRPAATTTPLQCSSKQRSNTSNASDDTPPQRSSSTTRHKHAPTRPARRCIATTCAGCSAAPSITSLPCDDRSSRSTCGVAGLAATPSTSSDSVTSSNNSPASAAGTNTPTDSKRSAKRYATGPATPASTCPPAHGTAEPSNEAAPDSNCEDGRQAAWRAVTLYWQTVADPAIAPKPGWKANGPARRSPQRHEPGRVASWREALTGIRRPGRTPSKEASASNRSFPGVTFWRLHSASS
jgi:hypothetical protein